MNEVLFTAFGVTFTSWKLIGLVGALMFASRWFVQLWATGRHKRVMLPMMFWYLSIVGSLMTLGYFIWGKNDAVGVLQNLFPAFVAAYNVFVHMRHERGGTPPAAQAGGG